MTIWIFFKRTLSTKRMIVARKEISTAMQKADNGNITGKKKQKQENLKRKKAKYASVTSTDPMANTIL
jgi:hypothetical protein